MFPLARGRGANRSSFIGKIISSEDLLLVAIQNLHILGVLDYRLALLWSHGQPVNCWTTAGEHTF